MTPLSIMEIGRAFMQEVPENLASGDCVFYAASVKSKPKEALLDRKGNYITPPKGFWHNWDAEFNIRFGNTQIHLHASDNDPKLKEFEKKLKALRNACRFYVNEFNRRFKNHPREYPMILERQWLNPLTKDTPYSGYFLYALGGPESSGSGRFFIADCQRSINMWIDIYNFDDGPIIPTHTQRNLDALKCIAENLDVAISKLDNLRKRYRNGELTRMEPKNHELPKSDISISTF